MFQGLLIILGGEGGVPAGSLAFPLGIAGSALPGGRQRAERLQVADRGQGLVPFPLPQQPLRPPVGTTAARAAATDQPEADPQRNQQYGDAAEENAKNEGIHRRVWDRAHPKETGSENQQR